MNEDPDFLVDLTTARTEFEAETIANALEAHGIDAKVFANVGATLQWEVAASQPIKVAVRRRDLETARSVLRTVKADSVDLDWSEVDTGDRSALSERELAELKTKQCPACGYSLEGIRSDARCPECGTDLRKQAARVSYSEPAKQPNSVRTQMAVAFAMIAAGAGAAVLPGRLGLGNPAMDRALMTAGAVLVLIGVVVLGLSMAQRRAAKR